MSVHLTEMCHTVEGAEVPERILTQAFEDMKSDIVRLRQATVTVIASKKQIQGKHDVMKRAVVRAVS
jgi:phage shock protein A